MSEYDKQYYWKNKDKKLKSHSDWARTLSGQFHSSKNKAKYRNIDWSLTFEEYSILRNAECYYCLGKLPTTSNGLDRIDSSKGYVTGNVVPCCSGCNRLKFDALSQKETIEVVNLLKKLRNTDNIWG